MHPVFFWTDILIDVLLITGIIFVMWSRKQAHIMRPWQGVMKSNIAAGAMVLLSAFVLIGLLDSFHYTNNHKTHSVLDSIVSPLGTQHEKTYSAPFATHLYNKETVVLAQGRVTRTYPNLKYVKNTSVLKKLLISFGVGLAIALSLLFLQHLFSRKPLLKNKTWTAQHTRWLSLVFIMIIFSMLFMLSRDYHILGTDKVGQDVFYATLKSVRTGLVIGTLTTLVMLPFAVLLGSMAGFWGGRIDDIIQYLYTTLSAVPGVLLIAAAILSIQVYITNHADQFPNLESRADMRLLALCIILGVTSWTSLCRIIRAETLKLRESDFIQAARVLGVRPLGIIIRHIIPNVMPIILITVVLDFSGLVLAEAVLSYVGVGVDPTAFSWGNMINAARLELAREPVVWWPLLAAFIAMFSLVLSANLFADTVREAFDPRQQ